MDRLGVLLHFRKKNRHSKDAVVERRAEMKKDSCNS